MLNIRKVAKGGPNQPDYPAEKTEDLGKVRNIEGREIVEIRKRNRSPRDLGKKRTPGKSPIGQVERKTRRKRRNEGKRKRRRNKVEGAKAF